MEPVTLSDGRVIHARSATAREFFDLQEAELSDRVFNMRLMAQCLVDDSGAAVFDEDSIQDLPLPEFRKLQNLVTAANGQMDEDEQGKGSASEPASDSS